MHEINRPVVEPILAMNRFIKVFEEGESTYLKIVNLLESLTFRQTLVVEGERISDVSEFLSHCQNVTRDQVFRWTLLNNQFIG